VILAGVDAARGEWLAVVLEDGRFTDAGFFPDLGSLLAGLGDVEIVAVDVPIGLPSLGGFRRADAAARAFVGARRSSVFAAPPAEALAPTSYRDARLVAPSLSAQAYALRRAILDAAAHPDPRLREVHPEVSFRALAGRDLPFAKRTWNGHADRRSLLAEVGIVIPDQLPAGLAPVDDVLDAAAAAWSASRIAGGTSGTLPADPAPGDPVIWY
jgi:predicted RNase H-like nuclease